MKNDYKKEIKLMTSKIFRLTDDDISMLKEGAERNGMNESQWVRYLIKWGLKLDIRPGRNDEISI
jgi:hypothetical protein